MQVTAVACERKIVRFVAATMLGRDYMFDMERYINKLAFSYVAIFTLKIGPFTNDMPSRPIH